MNEQDETDLSREIAKQLYALRDSNPKLRADIPLKINETIEYDLDQIPRTSRLHNYIRFVGKDTPHLYLFDLESGYRRFSTSTCSSAYAPDTRLPYQKQISENPKRLPNLKEIGVSLRKLTRQGEIEGTNHRLIWRLIYDGTQ